MVQRFKCYFLTKKNKNSQKSALITANGKRYGSRCFNKLGSMKDFMHETLKFDVTVRFALSDKLALKMPNVLIKNGVSR
jgi:hypothetical protein